MSNQSPDTWPLMPQPPVEPPARPSHRRAYGWVTLAGGVGGLLLGSTVGPVWLWPFLAGGYLVVGAAWHLVADAEARRRRTLLSKDPAGMTGPARWAWRDRVEVELGRLEDLQQSHGLTLGGQFEAERRALWDALNRSFEADWADPYGRGLR